MAYTDSDLLGQVILNILKNAIEAGAGIVTVEAEIGEDESIEIKAHQRRHPRARTHSLPDLHPLLHDQTHG